MESFEVVNETRGAQLARSAERATALFARLRGLLGRDELPQGSGLHIDPCNSIHTFFMRFTIDAAFLDDTGCAVQLVHSMPPWRVTRVYVAAQSVLELPAGTLARTGTQVGDRFRFARNGAAPTESTGNPQ